MKCYFVNNINKSFRNNVYTIHNNKAINQYYTCAIKYKFIIHITHRNNENKKQHTFKRY